MNYTQGEILYLSQRHSLALHPNFFMKINLLNNYKPGKGRKNQPFNSQHVTIFL